MAVIGVALSTDQLVFTKGRDFRWAFKYVNEQGASTNFPAGELFFEFELSPVVKWDFTLSGDTAVIKKESEDVALIPARTKWQLVWMPQGEAAGGDPVAYGTVKVQAV